MKPLSIKYIWRSLVKDRTVSVLNICGLALGICSSLFILIWVQDERQVDHFHEQRERLFQVYSRNFFEGKIETSFATQGLLAQELKNNIPEIEKASGFEYMSAPGTKSNVEVKEKTGKMLGFFAANDFLSMFTYPLLQGSKTTALSIPDGIAISHQMANYFFGDPEKAMGQTIILEGKDRLQVTAVFEDLPSYSSQQFDFLRGWQSFLSQNAWASNWGNASPATFVLLKPEADPLLVENKIKEFLYQYLPRQTGVKQELAFQAYSDRYLNGTFKDGHPNGGRITYVRLFTLLAIFILLIACINFINLTTAGAIKRAKEIGLLKTLGANRSSLTMRYILEAATITGISLGISIILVYALLPVFEQVTNKQLPVPFTSLHFWLGLLAIWLTVSLLAGSYPALYLSSLKPMPALKEKITQRNVFFRKGLVVFQFCLSVILLVAMFVFKKQMDFVQQSNIGYVRDNLVYIPIEAKLINQYALFKTEALSISGVLSISKMRNSPTYIEHHTNGISWKGKPEGSVLSFTDAVVGYDFAKTMKLSFKEGRDFSTSFGADTAAFIINETAARAMGITQPIGQMIDWDGRQGQVIGVLKDFHFNSMHQTIEPLIARLDENWGWGTILVRLAPEKTKAALAGLQALSEELNPAIPFTYQFADLDFMKLYQSEQMVSNLAAYFAVLAILISCLGLFGLTIFMTSSRVKEIGVRKVLGASVSSIVYLLSVGFLKLVIIAFLLGIPLAWWASKIWLANFAYHIDLSWELFAITGLSVICIALTSVGWHSVRAALANPADSLRNE